MALASAQAQAMCLSHGSGPFTPDLVARIARATAVVIGLIVLLLGLFGALTTGCSTCRSSEPIDLRKSRSGDTCFSASRGELHASHHRPGRRGRARVSHSWFV